MARKQANKRINHGEEPKSSYVEYDVIVVTSENHYLVININHTSQHHKQKQAIASTRHTPTSYRKKK